MDLTREQVEKWAKTWKLSGGELARALIALDDALKSATDLADDAIKFVEAYRAHAPSGSEWVSSDSLTRYMRKRYDTARAAMLPRESE